MKAGYSQPPSLLVLSEFPALHSNSPLVALLSAFLSMTAREEFPDSEEIPDFSRCVHGPSSPFKFRFGLQAPLFMYLRVSLVDFIPPKGPLKGS